MRATSASARAWAAATASPGHAGRRDPDRRAAASSGRAASAARRPRRRPRRVASATPRRPAPGPARPPTPRGLPVGRQVAALGRGRARGGDRVAGGVERPGGPGLAPARASCRRRRLGQRLAGVALGLAGLVEGGRRPRSTRASSGSERGRGRRRPAARRQPRRLARDLAQLLVDPSLLVCAPPWTSRPRPAASASAPPPGERRQVGDRPSGSSVTSWPHTGHGSPATSSGTRAGPAAPPAPARARPGGGVRRAAWSTAASAAATRPAASASAASPRSTGRRPARRRAWSAARASSRPLGQLGERSPRRRPRRGACLGVELGAATAGALGGATRPPARPPPAGRQAVEQRRPPGRRPASSARLGPRRRARRAAGRSPARRSPSRRAPPPGRRRGRASGVARQPFELAARQVGPAAGHAAAAGRGRHPVVEAEVEEPHQQVLAGCAGLSCRNRANWPCGSDTQVVKCSKVRPSSAVTASVTSSACPASTSSPRSSRASLVVAPRPRRPHDPHRRVAPAVDGEVEPDPGLGQVLADDRGHRPPVVEPGHEP